MNYCKEIEAKEEIFEKENQRQRENQRKDAGEFDKLPSSLLLLYPRV